MARRLAGHHKVAEGYSNPKLDCQVVGYQNGYPATRGREQQLIEQNGGARIWGGTSGNAINGVSKYSLNQHSYKLAADEHC